YNLQLTFFHHVFYISVVALQNKHILGTCFREHKMNLLSTSIFFVKGDVIIASVILFFVLAGSSILLAGNRFYYKKLYKDSRLQFAPGLYCARPQGRQNKIFRVQICRIQSRENLIHKYENNNIHTSLGAIFMFFLRFLFFFSIDFIGVGTQGFDPQGSFVV
ncbi:hypothetical protein ACJX0J_029283, partial [Zea mays]